MSITDKVAVIGAGMTKFGEHFEQGYLDLAVDAAYEAYTDAGVEPGQIQAAWLSTAFPDSGGYEGQSGASLAEALGLYGIPISRVVNYCASGMDAFRNACLAVAAGMYDVALVVGVEKMRDVASRESLVAQIAEHGHPVLGKGLTAPDIFALCANRYFHEFGIGRETLAQVAVKNHAHGALNPQAHFQRPATVAQVLNAPMIAEPLGLFDCSPVTDGAAAVVVASRTWAEAHGRDLVLVKGIGLAAGGPDTLFFDPTFDFLGFASTRQAAQDAYRQAGITDPRSQSSQIDFAEVHDCFTITEILNYEDLGFAPRGEGHRLIAEGVTRLGGALPVNPSGGLKSCGHPIGATGVRMIYELTTQLRGRAGQRQVPNPHVGLAHNLGGIGSVACVAILGV